MDGLNSAWGSLHALAIAQVAYTPPARLSAYIRAAQDEIDSLVSIAPDDLRANARWAIPALLDAARSGGMTHPRRIAYLLATVEHVAEFGARLEEPQSAGNLERCEPKPLDGSPGDLEPSDADRFRGRGFIFIRGRAQYATWSRRLGMPDRLASGRGLPYLVAHPQALARPEVAARAIVRGLRDGLFTGVPLGQYINDKRTDYYNARRTIDAGEHARAIAASAPAYHVALEDFHAERHRASMAPATSRTSGPDDVLVEIRNAVDRLASRGEPIAVPTHVTEWTGEAHQGIFVQLNDRTCALHTGRGAYIRLDIQRDLNGITPPEGRIMALKRSGEVRLAARAGDDFWR